MNITKTNMSRQEEFNKRISTGIKKKVLSHMPTKASPEVMAKIQAMLAKQKADKKKWMSKMPKGKAMTKKEWKADMSKDVSRSGRNRSTL